MKLSTLNSKLSLISVGSNAKTVKGDSDTTLTAIMYLSPHKLAGRGNVCKQASQGCIDTCLNTSGRAIMSNVQQARIRKTRLFFDDNSLFKEKLYLDLDLFNTYCKDNSITGYVRLNGTSDIDWQKIKLKDNKCPMELFSDLNFYDYTKDMKRNSKYKNYYITYSYSENVKKSTVTNILNNNQNVAVVFTTLPKTWEGFDVIDGDKTDLRVLDKKGVIVGLVAKGLAKKIKTDFVVDPNKILITNEI